MARSLVQLPFDGSEVSLGTGPMIITVSAIGTFGVLKFDTNATRWQGEEMSLNSVSLADQISETASKEVFAKATTEGWAVIVDTGA